MIASLPDGCFLVLEFNNRSVRCQIRAIVFTIIYIVLSPDSQRELQMPKQRQTQPWSEPSWARDRLHPAHWASTQLPYTEFLLNRSKDRKIWTENLKTHTLSLSPTFLSKTFTFLSEFVFLQGGQVMKNSPVVHKKYVKATRLRYAYFYIICGAFCVN